MVYTAASKNSTNLRRADELRFELSHNVDAVVRRLVSLPQLPLP